jgi:fucose 4-O-acetylase-like acetyltransferase
MKEKNAYIDSIRGLAILLVVLGHTITGCMQGYENNILYNVIWSLQMPLFFVISGYITKYSKPLTSCKIFLKSLFRRSGALLIPYFVWTFVVRGILMGQSSFFNLKNLIFNFDSGYWFLFSLWTISVIFMSSRYIAGCISDRKIPSTILTLVFIAVFSVLLLFIGLKVGLSFLNIKQTTYYIPFFVLGYLYGAFQEKMKSLLLMEKIVIALATFFWVFVLLKCSIVSLGEDVVSIMVRFFSSVCGCICCFGLLSNLIKGRIAAVLQYIGSHTLEIYLVHYVFLCMIPAQASGNALSSFVPVAINYILTLGVTVLSFTILNQNGILKKALFFK